MFETEMDIDNDDCDYTEEDEMLVEESDDEELDERDDTTNEVAYLTYVLGSDSDDDM